MKYTGKRAASAIIVLTAVIALIAYALDHELFNFIVLLITPFVWWMGRKHDEIRHKYTLLAKAKELADQHSLASTERINELEDMLHSAFGGVFSFHLSKDMAYFSKGIEQIYGYTYTELSENMNLWKEAVHPDDLDKIRQDEQQLLLGNATKLEYRILHPEHGVKWVVKKAAPFRNQGGSIVKINGQIVEITERKQLEHQLKQMAFYDELTGLPNRNLLDGHIQKALARSRRHQHNLTIMFIDLDNFKNVNDTLGHDAGDYLLKEATARINQSLREEDLISRIGGDEFIVVMEETSKEEIEDIAQRIVSHVSLPYTINDNEAKISLSIGISMYPDDGLDKESLIEHADQAMYFAKNNGKNRYKLYTSDLSDLEVKRQGLFEKLLSKIQNSKFFSL